MTAITLTGPEAKARTMLRGYAATKGIAANAVAEVFTAMWASALPVDRILAIASALGNCEYFAEPIKAELTRMTKTGVLRSRVERGTRLYEVAY